MKTDLNFKLASCKRNRLHKAYKVQNIRKTKKQLLYQDVRIHSSKTGSFISYMVILH